MLKLQHYVALSCLLALCALHFLNVVVASEANPAFVKRQNNVFVNNVSATIDFMLSNWWNNTKYLAQSNPNVAFLRNVSFVTQSQNATSTTPLIVGVEVQERRQYQRMKGLGASITDSTAIVLQSLRVDHPDAYDEILNLAFNESPEWIAKGGAGMNMIRMPVGASDFGFTQYTYDDTADGTPDPTLKLFDIEKSPKRWQTIQDILKINPGLIVIASTWSPPAWMKNSTGSLIGGSILEKYEGVYCDYLVKFAQQLKSSKGIELSYLSVMNNPSKDSEPRPRTLMSAEQQARVARTCRAKLNTAGLQKIKLLANDQGWDRYENAIQVYDKAKESFAGVSWSCGGDVDNQDKFNQAYPNQEVLMTSCTRISQYGKETWNNLKDQFSNLIVDSIDYMSSAIVLWNMVLQVDEEGFTVPIIPNQCVNCLAPFLVFANSTQPKLEGIDTQAYDAARKQGSKSSKRDTSGTLPQANAINVAPTTMNKGDANDGKLIPPFRANYYRTSDFVTLAHLGQAIRPTTTNNNGRWAQRVGVSTTDDNNQGGRIKAQLFRNSLGNGTSRWSMQILQWNDHYSYPYAAHEDMTVQIKFRDSVATVVLPPGVFTLGWTAQDSDYEKDF